MQRYKNNRWAGELLIEYLQTEFKKTEPKLIENKNPQCANAILFAERYKELLVLEYLDGNKEVAATTVEEAITMGALRKTVSSNLGEETDKDLINYVSNMEKKGINNSKLIKQALRFYRDYGNKVKQLDTVDIANILDNPEVKEYIGNIVGDFLKVLFLIQL